MKTYYKNKVATHGDRELRVERLGDRDVSIPRGWGSPAGVSRDSYRAFDTWAARAGAPSTLRLADQLYAHDRQIDTLQQQTRRTNDGVQLPESGVSYRRAITVNRESMTSLNAYDHYKHFRFDNSGADPRDNKIRRIEADVRGKASKYCCNTPTGTVALDMRGYETKRGWFGVTIDLGCWMERWEQEKDDLLNEFSILRTLAEELLLEAHCEVTFEGDSHNKLRGLKQAQVNHIRLDTPFDEDTYEGCVDKMQAIAHFNSLLYGGSGKYKLTHMILPPAFDIVLDKERTQPNSCCDDLSTKFYRYFNGRKVSRDCSWLQELGKDNKTAMVLYARDSFAVYVDHAVPMTWLPPKECDGRMQQTLVMKAGEFITTDPSAMLVVSNVLTGRC